MNLLSDWLKFAFGEALGLIGIVMGVWLVVKRQLPGLPRSEVPDSMIGLYNHPVFWGVFFIVGGVFLCGTMIYLAIYQPEAFRR